MRIHIGNLRLRTIVGIEEWEKKSLQDVILNMALEFEGEAAGRSDAIEDTVNYKTLTKQVIALVEGHSFGLLEKMVTDILDLLMAHPKVLGAWVEAEKPGALRFADSVSIEGERVRE